jgi:hypothetical protein
MHGSGEERVNLNSIVQFSQSVVNFKATTSGSNSLGKDF